jgi:hypothetical protein
MLFVNTSLSKIKRWTWGQFQMTILTLEWLCVGIVYARMIYESFFWLETRVAHIALERFLCCVRTHVQPQRVLKFECVTAELTTKRTLFFVRLVMGFQMPKTVKRFFTNFTFVLAIFGFGKSKISHYSAFTVGVFGNCEIFCRVATSLWHGRNSSSFKDVFNGKRSNDQNIKSVSENYHSIYI